MNSDDDDDIHKPPLDESQVPPQSPPPTITIGPPETEKERKKREKQEQKEREKRERLEKSAGERNKSAGKSQNEPGNFVKNTFSTISGFFTSPRPSKTRPDTRPKEGVTCRVLLLDGSEYQTVVDKYAYGQHLLDKVCEHVNLIEKEYFSLTFIGKRGILFWLILDRRIIKQVVQGAVGPWVFDFRVKFYPPEPTILQEDITRYQLCLQLRSDISSGKLPCTFVTYALLGSYTVQSELGDFEINPNGRETDYVQDIVFSPTQTEDLLQKIVELHKTHRGQLPIDAELNFLENAKKLQMYGVHFVPARDSELVLIWLGVYYGGVIIVRDGVVINKFPWPKILKLSYKKKKYYMKLRPAEYEQFEKTIGFQMESHTHAKNFWRLALEHHTFFRFKQANAAEKNSRSFSLLSLSSRHRYSGRTQYQTRSQRIHRSQPDFDRTFSRRTGRSLGGYSMASSTSFDRQGEAWLSHGASQGPGLGVGDELLNEIGKVSVLAGTGSNVNKLAYVKTVAPGVGEAGAHELQFNEQGSFIHEEVDASTSESSKKKKKKKSRPSLDDDPPQQPQQQQFYDEDDVTQSQPPAYHSIYRDESGGIEASRPKVPPKPKGKKKKKGVSKNEEEDDEEDLRMEGARGVGPVTTEYRTERRGRIEVVNGHRGDGDDDGDDVGDDDDFDHDMALRRAIESVTDVDHRLSVKKIQLDTDQLNSRGGGGGDKEKKKKGKGVKREPVPA